MTKHQAPGKYNPGEYVSLIYSDRMRTTEDKQNVFNVYDRVFGECFPSYKSAGRFHITDKLLQVGHSFIERKVDGNDVSIASMHEVLFIIYCLNSLTFTFMSLMTYLLHSCP